MQLIVVIIMAITSQEKKKYVHMDSNSERYFEVIVISVAVGGQLRRNVDPLESVAMGRISARAIR